MKRYNVGYCGMDLHKEGEYVTYQGHATKIRQLEIELEKAALTRLEQEYDKIYKDAYDRGWQDGYSVGCDQ